MRRELEARVSASRKRDVRGRGHESVDARSTAHPQLDVAVRAVVARQLRVPPDDLAEDLHLERDLGVTAHDAPQLLSAMGEALDATFPDDFLDGVHTYGDLTTAVKISLGP
jgi:acyl carrier protein